MREPFRVIIKDIAGIGRDVFTVQLRALSPFLIFVIAYTIGTVLGIELVQTYGFLALIACLLFYVVYMVRRLVYFVRGKKASLRTLNKRSGMRRLG
jgi:hypothetical protein